MNELHLFAGAGGGILGGMLLGHTCVCAVEIEPYPRKVLFQRQRDGILPKFPIWDDITTFDGKPWRGIVDVVCGGFPCQDISAAGKGAGITGERSGLWSEMARVVREVGPRYVFVENSPMLTIRGLGVVLRDLAAMGYNARWCVLGAIDAGAPHKRERIWILATHASFERRDIRGGDRQERSILRNLNRDAAQGEPERQGRQRWIREIGANVADSVRVESAAGLADSARGKEGNAAEPIDGSNDVAYPDNAGSQGSQWKGAAGTKGASRGHIKQCGCSEDVRDADEGGLSQPESEPVEERPEAGASERSCITGSSWWAVEPALGRVANGVARRVDRLKSIGNGQVSSVVKLAWETLSGGI